MVDWIISKAGEEAPVVLTTLCEADFTGYRQTGSVRTLTRGHMASELEHLLEPGPDPVS